jgi:hypothetical protein
MEGFFSALATGEGFFEPSNKRSAQAINICGLSILFAAMG